MDEHEERDKNVLFKFKVGDIVRKAWRWRKGNDEYDYCRYGGAFSPGINAFPIGTIGKIIEIHPDNGKIVILRKNGVSWSVGASELDFATLEEIKRWEEFQSI